MLWRASTACGHGAYALELELDDPLDLDVDVDVVGEAAEADEELPPVDKVELFRVYRLAEKSV